MLPEALEIKDLQLLIDSVLSLSGWYWKQEAQDFERHIFENNGGEVFRVSDYNTDTIFGIEQVLKCIRENYPDDESHSFVCWLKCKKSANILLSKIQETKFQPGDSVLYIPNHANGNPDHPECERGVVSTVQNIDNGKQLVWVRFKGPTGKSCAIKNLVKL